MPLRPADLIDNFRSDHSQTIEGGQNVNTAGVRLRSELPTGESRHTFALALSESHSSNAYPHVQPPLQNGNSRELVYLEGYLNDIQNGVDPQQAVQNNQGAWQPPAGLNLITTLTATSFTEPCVTSSYVNGNQQSRVYDDDPGWSFGQVAGLSEFREFVNLLGATLDGSNTISWEVDNEGPNAARGSVIIRLLGKVIDQ
jgi:hypothetical protein